VVIATNATKSAKAENAAIVLHSEKLEAQYKQVPNNKSPAIVKTN
jgi:hypothetical protein